MNIAAELLALVQLGRLAKGWYDDYQRGLMTEDEVKAAWAAMQPQVERIHAKLHPIDVTVQVKP